MLSVVLLVVVEAVAAFNSSEHPVKVKEELMASCCFPLAVFSAYSAPALKLAPSGTSMVAFFLLWLANWCFLFFSNVGKSFERFSNLTEVLVQQFLKN